MAQVAYYVTGFEMDKSKLGYYIFDSNTRTTKYMSQNTLLANKDAIKDLVNARLGSVTNKHKGILMSRGRKGVKSIYKPALVKGNQVKNNTDTLVYINFISKKYGLVNYEGDITWHTLGNLQSLPRESPYNNLCYLKDCGFLDLLCYHIIGMEESHSILLHNYIEKEQEEQGVEERLVNTGENKNSNLRDVVEVLGPTEDLEVGGEGNLDIKTGMEKELNQIKSTHKEKSSVELANDECGGISNNTEQNNIMSPQDFYEDMIMTLRGFDTITLPKEIFNNIRFKIEHNLETSMELNKRVSLGTVFLNNFPKVPIIAIAKVDESLDTVKFQVMRGAHIEKGENYSFGSIKEEYLKWRSRKKYLSI